ncbi:hypothetical protein GGE07_004925 [Sinorhizobium terangae]|nr:hypothetical protein [Sinorhizobium terangae]
MSPESMQRFRDNDMQANKDRKRVAGLLSNAMRFKMKQ